MTPCIILESGISYYTGSVISYYRVLVDKGLVIVLVDVGLIRVLVNVGSAKGTSRWQSCKRVLVDDAFASILI